MPLGYTYTFTVVVGKLAIKESNTKFYWPILPVTISFSFHLFPISFPTTALPFYLIIQYHSELVAF